jgi:HEAT repeat protein
LIAALRDDSPLVRAAAAHALGDLKDRRAIGPLVAALERKDEEAGPALAQFQEAAIGPLIGCLREAPARYSAAEVLAHIGKPAVGPLIEAFQSDDGNARLAAAEALSEIDDPQAAETLKAALRNGDLKLSAAAYKFLMRTSMPGSEELLIKCLNTYGQLTMARDFISSGRPVLKAAAERWASENRYATAVLYEPGASNSSRP